VLELRVQGIQKIIVFLGYDGGWHDKDRRNVSDDPFIADPLQCLGGGMVTPSRRKVGNIDVLHFEIVWKLRRREDEILDGPADIQMNVEFQRREGNSGGCIYDGATGRVPPSARESCASAVELRVTLRRDSPDEH
jgi:hypothetical protein